MLKAFMATLIATQAAAAPPAQPAAPRCLTRAHVGSLGVVGAAIMVNVSSNACRRHLRPGAFLLSASGTAFVATLRTHGRQRLPDMIQGLTAMRPDPHGLTVAIFSVMANRMLANDAGADWADYGDPQVCRDADEVASIMAELTPDQIGRLTGAFAAFGDQMSRIMPRVFSDPRFSDAFHAPAAGGTRRPRPLSFQSPSAPAPVIVTQAPPGPPPPPRPPRPPLICPEAG